MLQETRGGAGYGKPNRNQISGNPQIGRPIHYNENAREENQNIAASNDIEHILAAAQKHITAGELREAVRLLQSVLASVPDRDEALDLSGANPTRGARHSRFRTRGKRHRPATHLGREPVGAGF
ncbi:hypothetical protein [Paraburkholderia adhaesiva]|uniref:hypothetical protein n=1 Tax=Paraburkholderia adhaesiva TaxID=2883244 RepID=UPI001F35481B|nr:hypothetical protein [Paraburkholderia adhaesiva]